MEPKLYSEEILDSVIECVIKPKNLFKKFNENLLKIYLKCCTKVRKLFPFFKLTPFSS